ncbi:MAG: D-aminoacyl-tRNA deacylase [Rhodobacter sp.]|jgi:D-aminoacyl-tRNA deacylase|tara:strand:+ start:808 stop:963 length:156 start_codon:yes stop_codon:yes gene_type:complete
MSQFTLAADLRGNRQGFSTAATPNEACAIDEVFAQDIASFGIQTTNGVFGQ